jgi:formylglycine-generating enzyme required for sulfatase activity
MGSDPGEGFPDEEPEHQVILTPYFIDKYEVSNDRYRECVQAGVCQEPPHASYFEPALGDYPVQGVTWADAHTFCVWDGGRTLPSEAQWEKAARGPAPSEVPNPWGWDSATCGLVVAQGCWQGDYAASPVDSHASGASYYGVHHMADNISEYCLDWYDANYYAGSCLVDPTGPQTGTEHSVRGKTYGTPLDWFDATVPFRTSTGATHPGIRCGRRGY